MPTSNAFNVTSPTSEGEKAAPRQWQTQNRARNSTPNSSYALHAARNKPQTASNTENNTFPSNADSAVQ